MWSSSTSNIQAVRVVRLLEVVMASIPNLGYFSDLTSKVVLAFIITTIRQSSGWTPLENKSLPPINDDVILREINLAFESFDQRTNTSGTCEAIDKNPILACDRWFPELGRTTNITWLDFMTQLTVYEKTFACVINKNCKRYHHYSHYVEDSAQQFIILIRKLKEEVRPIFRQPKEKNCCCFKGDRCSDTHMKACEVFKCFKAYMNSWRHKLRLKHMPVRLKYSKDKPKKRMKNKAWYAHKLKKKNSRNCRYICANKLSTGSFRH